MNRQSIQNLGFDINKALEEHAYEGQEQPIEKDVEINEPSKIFAIIEKNEKNNEAIPEKVI